ncbi:MAG TPA: SurA N-terminal domain-containing protein [Dehalococcoidia bacterium]
MSRRRTKIPTPSWEHEQSGITRKLEANRWQLWATAGVVMLVLASLAVVGWAFLSDYIEDQQRPGSLGLRVADRELTVREFGERAVLFVEETGSPNANSILPALSADLIEEALLLQFAEERSATASEEEVRAEIADKLGIEAGDANFDARLEEELTRTSLSEEEYTDIARADVLAEKMQESFTSDVPDELPSVNYRQIRVADQETADDLVAQLEEGADFETLAAENSTDSGTAEPSWVAEGVLEDAADDVLFALEVNEIGTYFQAGAVLIYEVLEKSDSREVDAQHRGTLGRKAYGEWLADKRESVEVVNHLDLQAGDVDKLRWVIDYAELILN